MTVKPRLAILTLSFPPQTGGVQAFLYETARRWTNTHEVIIITPVQPTAPEPFKRLVIPAGTIPHFHRALRELKPGRVLLGHTHPQLLLPAWWHGPFSALAYGNDYLTAQQRWHKPLFNWLLRQAQPLITITHANANRLEQLGLPRPGIIYPGTDPHRFTPASQPNDHLTLLSLCRLVPRKGVDTVLQALPQLLSHFPHLRYHIGGNGPDRPRLQQLTHDLNLSHAVRFLGRVPDADLPALYRQASVFVMPVREEADGTSIEGFGIVYLEASASGLPVIAGQSGGAVEAVKPGKTGYLVPPNDPQTLAQTLLPLLANPDLRQQLGRSGRVWVEQEMNWDNTAHNLLTLLSKS